MAVPQLLRPLLEHLRGPFAQLRDRGAPVISEPRALVITERRGIGEARCLPQQPRGALLQGARALADGVGQVPQPRARGLVERREVDGLQILFHGKLT